MSLAKSIADQLNGRKSGNGFVIPTICHGGTGFNLQISDGYNGKLSAYCHSNCCDYQTIMQALEDGGYKPRDNFTPEQKQAFKKVTNRTELMRLLYHEMHVLLLPVEVRFFDRYKRNCREYIAAHPEYKPMPAELWEREKIAINRVHELTGKLK